MNTDTYKLASGSRVAIIGGGPAGCFFALYLNHSAREHGIRPDITLYESRDFSGYGPKGCKGCAGIGPFPAREPGRNRIGLAGRSHSATN